MDAISNFLLQKKNLTIPVLFSTFYHLQVIQLQQPNLSFPDLEETVKTVATSGASPIAEDELKTYAGILYEACTVPKMGADGPMFTLDESLTLGEQVEQKLLDRFLKVFTVRDNKLGGKYSSLIEEWKKEGKKFVQQEVGNEKEFTNTDSDEETAELGPYNSNAHQQQHNQHHSMGSMTSYVPRPSNVQGGDNSKPFTGPIESNKFVARFLAHMRRSGMDMVFPQLIHDKVLLTVFIAAKCSGPIAHRDLIDMILAAKDSQVLGNDLELVSKTKVRGVVTLARNSHALIVVEKGDGQGETVKLAVGKGLTTFKSFRRMHDSFINLCLSQRHLFLPVNVKGEILWPTDEKFVAERCHELMRDEAILESFFLTGGKKSSPHFSANAEAKPTFAEASRGSVIGSSLPSKPVDPLSLISQKPVSLPPSTYGYEVSKPASTYDLSDSSFGSYAAPNRGFLGSSTPSETFSFGSSSLSSVLPATSQASTTTTYGSSRNDFVHSRFGDEKDLGGFSGYGNVHSMSSHNGNSSNNMHQSIVHGHGQLSQGHGLPQTRSFSGSSANGGYYHNNNNNPPGLPPQYRTEERLMGGGHHNGHHHHQQHHSNLQGLNDASPFSTYSTYYSNNNNNSNSNYKF